MLEPINFSLKMMESMGGEGEERGKVSTFQINIIPKVTT
jgi:hypothetical protein